MKVLAIGTGAGDLCAQFWPEAEIDTAMKPPKTGNYDGVVVLNALQLQPYRKVKDYLKKCYSLLKEGGELHVFCPSLEWAAVQIISENPSPILLKHLYSDGQKSAFTLRQLRELFRSAGIPVKAARVGQNTVRVGENTYAAEQHWIVGYK